MNRPNILYIHSHDTGRFVQPYGHAIPTPNLQKVAEQGVLFRQAFCQTPSCSASRAALLTGQCSHSAGMLGLAHRGWKLHDYKQHLIHTLKKAGYQSTLCGVQHVAAGPDSVKIIGYDNHLPTPTMRVKEVAPRAAAWLKNAPPEPFFLDVGFVETHTLPNEPGSLFGCEPGDPRHVLPPPTMSDTPQTRQDMADFKAAARVLDGGIGQVLDALEHSRLAANTLVISTTDHGIPLPGCKCHLTDHGLGVLLMLRGPAPFDGGRVCDAMVSHIDVFPTLCDWLQIEPPSWLQGKSLMPLVRGECEEINDELCFEVTHHAAYEPQRAVRTKKWKYIRQFEDRERPVLPNCDDSASKTFWVEHDWRERKVNQEQLYDLIFDPHEACNVADNPALALVLDEMRARLNRWMHATQDPLLAGPVPVPSGTMEKDPDDLSPSQPGR